MANIVNTTITFSLSTPLKLNYLASRLWNVEYDPKHYNGMKLRLRNPRCTALVFSTGNCVLVGANCFDEGRKAIRIIARKISKLISGVKLTGIKLKNCVASGKINFPLNHLKDALTEHGIKWSHEPELFPALIFKLNSINVTIFHTGTIFLTGSTSEVDTLSTFIDICLL